MNKKQISQILVLIQLFMHPEQILWTRAKPGNSYEVLQEQNMAALSFSNIIGLIKSKIKTYQIKILKF